MQLGGESNELEPINFPSAWLHLHVADFVSRSGTHVLTETQALDERLNTKEGFVQKLQSTTRYGGLFEI